MDQPEVTSTFVDWVTAVAPTTKGNQWLSKFLRGQDTKPVQRAYHRSHAVQYYPSGVRHYFSPQEIGLPSVIVCDGECLSNMRSEHDNEWCLKFVAILARNCDHFSRIDLAVDIQDKGLLAVKLAANVVADKVDFGRRRATIVMGQGQAGGTTVYVGARTSPKMLRVYDKFAESKGVNPSTRIEFELKAESAGEVCKRLASFAGHRLPGSLFNGLLGEFASWEDYEEILSLMYGDVCVVHIPKRERLLSRKEWLTKQVLPTFVKEPFGEGGELWRWFKELVEAGHKGA